MKGRVGEWEIKRVRVRTRHPAPGNNVIKLTTIIFIILTV
jgi:hypothetical protein